jgi:hypothetical protein
MADKDILELVLIRLESMPENFQVNLGNNQILQKADLISHVKNQDDLGKKIMNVQMQYLRELKNL